MKPYGIVVCGGRSARMGTDKSQLVYHDVPQYRHVCNLLAPICEKVLISCNTEQFLSLKTNSEKLVDLPEFAGHGPIAAVLTAFKTVPENDLLIVGCDYPFLDAKELSFFLSSVKRDSLAAAFYNSEGMYEPMLAWYSKSSAPLLQAFFKNGEYSLQHFLNDIGAQKYLPESKSSMISVDTPGDFHKTLERLSEKK